MRKPNIKTQLKNRGLRLNDEQLAAIKDLEGVTMVSAGAGTGKTSLIVGKVNYAAMVNPCTSILAITFTRKAVAELQSRIVGNANVMVSTFHAFFYRILRANGYKSFKFLENDNQKRSFMKDVLADIELEEKITPESLEEALRKGICSDDDMHKAVCAYLDYLKVKRLMCFDSLQYFCLEVLRMQPAVAVRVRGLYDYVMVDEVQDMSVLQKQIIQLIWPNDKKCNITFVGDQKQSIYGFRGSCYAIMDNLQCFYDAKSYKLTTNYRSSEKILSVANNVLPSDENLKATRGAGKDVEFCAADNNTKEAEYIAEQIKLMHNGGTALKDIVILFRASHAVRDVYEVFIKQRIPFVQVGSDPLRWNSSRYKAFLALLAWMHDHDNSHYSCALPVLGLPKNITEDIDETLNLPFSASLMSITSMSSKHRAVLEQFFAIKPEKYALPELIKIIWDNYLKAYFKAEDDDILQDFLDATSDFKTFTDLRIYINDCRRQMKQMQRLAANPNADYVRLMSIHTSKGLEFPVVFLAGAVEGILPDLTHDTVNIDEENRLAYVAVTRAKDRLYITYAKQGAKGNDAQSSRFFKQFFN